MTNRLRSSLSRLALPLLLLSPALLADTITAFNVEGTATNISGGMLGSCAAGATNCGFSGMFQVDVTTGKVESSGLDINFPGLMTFDTLDFSGPDAPFWSISVLNKTDDLVLAFTTAPTPVSLVGFTGGTITGVDLETFPGLGLYENLSGTIKPVPEPSSLPPLAGGISLLILALARRRRVRLPV